MKHAEIDGDLNTMPRLSQFPMRPLELSMLEHAENNLIPILTPELSIGAVKGCNHHPVA